MRASGQRGAELVGLKLFFAPYGCGPGGTRFSETSEIQLDGRGRGNLDRTRADDEGLGGSPSYDQIALSKSPVLGILGENSGVRPMINLGLEAVIDA